MKTMTAQRIKKLTVEEYVELEQSTNTKYEYHEGEVFAMAGASINHNRLSLDICASFKSELEHKNCEVFMSDTKINLQAYNDRYVYPDAMVVCGDIKQPENFKDAITNPVVIVEVLSESTEAYDRGAKFHQYSSITTFQEYVLISQNKPIVEVFYRKEPDNHWQINCYEGLETAFHLQSLNIPIEMKALYERVVFEQAS